MKGPFDFLAGKERGCAFLKWCLSAVAILMAAPACETVQAPAHATKAILEERHGEWSTRVLYTATEARFRASTWYGERDSAVVLNLDLAPGKCSNYVMTMNVGIPRTAQRSFSSDHLYGQIRVDDKSLHEIKYAYSTEQGQPVVFISFYAFTAGGDLWQELIQGNAVRFKLSAAERNYYLNFTLNGFSSAVTRIQEICIDLQNRTYFPN